MRTQPLGAGYVQGVGIHPQILECFFVTQDFANLESHLKYTPLDFSVITTKVYSTRVPTRPGKPGQPGKMRVHLENLEISWNFEKFNKYHGKMT